jgi:hypothetical protein
MRKQPWCVALGLFLLSVPAAGAQVVSGTLSVNQAHMG